MAAAALAVCLIALTGATTAIAETSTLTSYTATETIPVPPASNFAGEGGGDGWAVALSTERVYNVFHHQEDAVIVACHLQSNATPCAGWPKTITEPGSGNGFASQAQPGMYLDQHTGRLYVYATRLSDETGGVVCVETSSEATDPFCGFTELTGKGEAPLTTNRRISGMSNPMLIGTHLYSFNFAAGTPSGTQNELTCFDVSTDAACAGQPYQVALGAGQVTTNNNEPVGETATIGGKAIIPIDIEGSSWISCFDDATQKSCTGQWPIKLGFDYLVGAPFPLLSSTGATTGLCLPTGTDECFNLSGESVPTPEGMTAAIPGTEEWNGPGLVLGPRVYVPNGESDQVDCFDYSTGKACTNFPKVMQNLDLLYTVNPDPQRPTCIWVNSDGGGGGQIQDFDAYTGKACGQGTIRVLGSQFVVHQPQCTPASYVSVQVLRPARNTYTSGSVAFDDGDGNSIGLEERALDETGTVSLAGLELNTPTGLPQFLFTLNGEAQEIGEVEVKLTWTANYDATCTNAKTTATEPPHETKPESKPAEAKTEPKSVAKPTPKHGVLAFSTAHLASSPRACVAASSYLASVSGKNIASVTFTLDGHKLKTLSKANSHGKYQLSVPVKAGQLGHLAIHVKFNSHSSRRSQTITKTLARCAAAHHVSKPRFTG